MLEQVNKRQSARQKRSTMENKTRAQGVASQFEQWLLEPIFYTQDTDDDNFNLLASTLSVIS